MSWLIGTHGLTLADWLGSLAHIRQAPRAVLAALPACWAINAR